MTIRGSRHLNAGFTLVEVLIAVAITLTVATLAYGLFNNSIDISKRSEEVLEEINKIETLWQLLATDLDHAIDRSLPGTAAGVIGAGGTPALLGGGAARDSSQNLDGEYVLRLMREGWSNPLQQQRSDLQRVSYRWFEGQIWRDYWIERNQPLDEEPSGRRLLLEGVEEIRVRFLPPGASGVVSSDWVDSWPVSQGGLSQGGSPQGQLGSPKPVAMEVTLSLTGVGDVQRIFAFTN